MKCIWITNLPVQRKKKDNADSVDTKYIGGRSKLVNKNIIRMSNFKRISLIISVGLSLLSGLDSVTQQYKPNQQKTLRAQIKGHNQADKCE